MYIYSFFCAVGALLLILGAAYPLYVLPDNIYEKPGNSKLSRLNLLALRLESILAPEKKSKLNITMEKLIRYFDVEITTARLWLQKISCFFTVFVILLMISFTNTDILRQKVIGSWWQENAFMSSFSSEEYKYNASVYRQVLQRIGEEKIEKLQYEERLKVVRQALYDGRSSNQIINKKADAFLIAFDKSENIRVLSLNIIICSTIAFFLPEIILFLRKVVVGKKYKSEAIKMENVFGLLGTIEEYRAIDIIKEMAVASKIFSRQLNHAATIFYTDKNKSFEYLKGSIKERSFTRMVDTMRVYSTVDKKLALSILERNLKENEEQLLLSAEEDVDVVDILAFMSVIPILYEIANLMLNPMLDVVFNAFNFI